jgi:hypothetical protein
MSQQALMVEAIGKPVILGTKQIPEPKQDEILVKVSVGTCKFKDQGSDRKDKIS